MCALFRACLEAMHANQALRDGAAPVPGYAARYGTLLTQLSSLPPQLRKYIRDNFPKFLQDWQFTFVGSGIETDVKQMIHALSA